MSLELINVTVKSEVQAQLAKQIWPALTEF